MTAGNPAGAAVTGDGTLSNLTLLAGDNIVEQSLPIDPAGVVYDALTRTPVSGAVVTISGPPGFNPAIHLVGGSATVTTGADGMYQFLLVPGGTRRSIWPCSDDLSGWLRAPALSVDSCVCCDIVRSCTA